MSYFFVKFVFFFLLVVGVLVFVGIVFVVDLFKGVLGKVLLGGDKVYCYNVNSCKGIVDCKIVESVCKGQNSCKGMGFKVVIVKVCVDMNGIIVDL